jgi:hypothetical protein
MCRSDRDIHQAVRIALKAEALIPYEWFDSPFTDTPAVSATQTHRLTRFLDRR